MMVDLNSITSIITLNENGSVYLLKGRDYQQVITSLQYCTGGRTIRQEKSDLKGKSKNCLHLQMTFLCIKIILNHQQNIY